MNFWNLKAHPQWHISSNQVTSPNPAQTLHQLGTKHPSRRANWIHSHANCHRWKTIKYCILTWLLHAETHFGSGNQYTEDLTENGSINILSQMEEMFIGSHTFRDEGAADSPGWQGIKSHIPQKYSTDTLPDLCKQSSASAHVEHSN